MSNDERDDPDDPNGSDPEETESGEAGDGQPPADDAGSDDSWVSDSVNEGDESTVGDTGPTDPSGTGTDGTDDAPATRGQSADGSGGGRKGPNEKFCSECGAVINEKAEICPECGVRQPGMDSGNDERIVAALLAILLGSFGAHKFYLGNNKLGIIYLCFCWTGIPGIIGIIEGVIYLTKDDDEFRRQYMDE
ncbi:NINE protein [Halosimplex rubrum]|uniref:NINE protein n=1 Tax=Halosimplex rubrum TaxID=869889 RepID=A0A7D5T4J7_9EURY|nr:NINE protein [Halosimplex rubrum]QLH76135.1 NINE protein [Halosimplex rubrum]